MQRMSGIATRTNMYVERVSHTNASIRYPEDSASSALLRQGSRPDRGGTNHRFGLFDMILIKDNHIDAAGSVEEAIRRAKAYCQEQGFQRRLKLKSAASPSWFAPVPAART